MKKFVTAIVLLASAQAVFAIHPSGFTATSQTTSAKAIVGDKEVLLLEARDEADVFIMNGGDPSTMGPRLEKAIRELRAQNGGLQHMKDAEIAQDILDMTTDIGR